MNTTKKINLDHVWNFDIGDGQSGADITPVEVEGEPGFYISVMYEGELKLSDAELCAQEFERLANAIREHGKSVAS